MTIHSTITLKSLMYPNSLYCMGISQDGHIYMYMGIDGKLSLHEKKNFFPLTVNDKWRFIEELHHR